MSEILFADIQTGSNGKNGHGGTNLRRGHLPHRNDYLVPRLPASLGTVIPRFTTLFIENHIHQIKL